MYTALLSLPALLPLAGMPLSVLLLPATIAFSGQLDSQLCMPLDTFSLSLPSFSFSSMPQQCSLVKLMRMLMQHFMTAMCMALSSTFSKHHRRTVPV
jgi:hypothetical protein